MGAQLPGPLAGWLGATRSMPNSTMNRLEGAVARSAAAPVRWRAQYLLNPL
jgi:hypothetical protein